METIIYEGLTRETFTRILASVDNVRVGVFGDLCLDLYWDADMQRSSLSRETPHFPLPVVTERMAPGGAGNVAANLQALQPGALRVLGVVGEDWRSALLLQALASLGADCSDVVRTHAYVTNAYIKPMRHGISDTVYEDPRIDFENYTPLDADTERALLDGLERVASSLDVLCVCDQMRFGCVTEAVCARLARLSDQGLRVIVDSRERVGEYRNVLVKPNEVECVRAVWPDAAIPDAGDPTARARLVDAAARLCARNGRPDLVTLGDDGCLVAENGRVMHVPSRAVQPPLDICGAGDTFFASFACALGGGADARDAAAVANLAASVTITKIGMTGVTTRAELREAYALWLREKA